MELLTFLGILIGANLGLSFALFTILMLLSKRVEILLFLLSPKQKKDPFLHDVGWFGPKKREPGEKLRAITPQDPEYVGRPTDK